MFIFRSFLCTVQDMVPGGGVEGLGEGLDTQALRVPPLWEMATVRSSTIWVISVDPDATDTVRRMKTIALFKILFLMVLSCLLKVSDAAVPDMQWRNNPVMVAKSGHVMGRDTEVVVGKDRELFHFSIDLKWLCRKIASKTTWNSIFAMVADKVKMMHPGYQCELSYRDSALKCLMSISEFHPQPSVRVFQNSLHTATALAALRGKLVLMYVEEDRPEGMAPSARTLEARKALSDSKLGDFINEEVCDPQHRHHNLP